MLSIDTATVLKPVSRTLTVPLVTALDRLWSRIRTHHSDVPAVVLTIGAGSIGNSAGYLRLGHFAAARWQLGPNERLPEVFVGGEGLRRPAADVLGTLLHEAAHGLAQVRGVKDTSRQGRYHNTRFKKLAEELGLVVSDLPTIGWSNTTPATTTIGRYRRQLDMLTKALVGWRHSELHAAARPITNNGVVLLCRCERRIRLAQSTHLLGPITCGVCDTTFQPTD